MGGDVKDQEIRDGLKRLRGETPTGNLYERGADGKYRKSVQPVPYVWPMPTPRSRPYNWRGLQSGLLDDIYPDNLDDACDLIDELRVRLRAYQARDVDTAFPRLEGVILSVLKTKRIATVSELRQAMYGDGNDAPDDDGTIRVLIYRLRKKGLNIKTHSRGLGYELCSTP